MFGWALPSRSATPEWMKFMPWLTSQATWVSSMPMSMYWPWPVFAAWTRAPLMATAANMPDITSAIGTPTFCGSRPGSPVRLMMPPMPWIRKS